MATAPVRHDGFKRAFDASLAGIGLLCSLPLWGLFAAAIKLEDGGDVFYSQERVGKDGRIFLVCKFRRWFRTPRLPDLSRRASAIHGSRGSVIGYAPPRWTNSRNFGASFAAT